MTTETPHLILPVRPHPFEGEATVGFLMRVAQDNGYDALRQLGKIFRSFDGLCQALGLTTKTRHVLFGPYPSFGGHPCFQMG
jgi:hypothetical protein